MLKKISLIGILTCILYFISVGLFLITKADIALTIWELMTVISGPLVLLVMIGLAEFLSSPAVCKKIMLVAMGCTCALTGAAHIVAICRNGCGLPCLGIFYGINFPGNQFSTQR